MSTAERNDLTIIGAAYHDDLIGPGEIRQLAAGYLGREDRTWISARTLMMWRRGDFPQPVREIDIGPIWDQRHVVAWLEARYR